MTLTPPVEAVAQQARKQPLLSGLILLFLVAMIFANMGGNMWEKIGPLSPFIVTIVVSFLATIPAWFKFKLPKSTIGEKPSGNEEIKES